jgi:hypothetical protein
VPTLSGGVWWGCPLRLDEVVAWLLERLNRVYSIGFRIERWFGGLIGFDGGVEAEDDAMKLKRLALYQSNQLTRPLIEETQSNQGEDPAKMKVVN